MARVLRLPLNWQGRDFVTGDLHGCFDMLAEGLARIRFDPKRDRLFALGDLIDRGPQSDRTLDFLGRPGVFSVMGNHEAMVIDLYAAGPPDRQTLESVSAANGFGWWMDLDDQERLAMVAAFRDLPHAIEVETAMGLVGLVHAEVEHGADWERFRRDLFRPSRAREVALWGRRRIHAPGDAGVPGIARVFVGHTPVPSPRRFGNVVGIDTGAVYGWRAGTCRRGRLTLAELTVPDAILDAPTDPSAGWVDFRMTEPPPLDPFIP